MKATIFTLLFIVLLFSSLNAAGETYQLILDENSFDIEYDFDGQIIAMAIDNELSSLLIATENVQNDSIVEIEFPKELISAENDAFAILVNGYEVGYDIQNTNSTTKLVFPIFAFTEEIEIIGTKVIPEFPFSVVYVFGMVVVLSIIFSKHKKLSNNLF